MHLISSESWKKGDLGALRSLEEQFFAQSKSATIRAVDSVIADLASSLAPVLLIGEEGTGKELTALRIHRLSSRHHEGFSKVVCGEVMSETLEELLQGTEGTLTDAGPSGPGTIFLHRIDELSPACQTRLLRPIRNGSHAPYPGGFRARIIASAGCNFEEEVRLGRFREELYFRINGVCLRLPPLRHRREDLLGFIDFFLERHSGHSVLPKPCLRKQTIRMLEEYSWPGNIAQLESVIKEILVTGEDACLLDNLQAEPGERVVLPDSLQRTSLKQAARAASRQTEQKLILRALERTHWNRKRAAQDLQISYRALLYKLKQMGFDESAHSRGARGATT